MDTNGTMHQKLQPELIPPPAIPPLLVDYDGLAVLLGVSRRHVIVMVEAGEIDVRPIRLGRRVMFSVEAVKEWVRRKASK